MLPDFHRPDQDEELGCDTVSGDLNGALRSINEPLIIDDKLAAAQCLLDTVPVGGGEITLTAAQAEQWLTAINDVRLSLGAMLGIDEDTPIENRMITSTIESAQKKLEGRNFEIRKNVLKYDDVMNQQREIIYKQRQMVLDGEDISGKLHEMMRQAIDDACTNYLNGETADDWDFAGLRRHFMNWLCLPTDFNYTTE